MLDKIKLKCNLLVPAQSNTWVDLDDCKIAVQFWAVRVDGAITGIGIFNGGLVALDTLPDFTGYR